MRVLFTLPVGHRLGGAENMLWTVLRHSAGSRLEPSVAFLRPGPFAAEVQDSGIRTFMFDAGRLRHVGRFAATVRGLARTLRSEQPEVILNWTKKSQLYGAPAATLAGMSDRVVWWHHEIAGRNWTERVATALPAKAVGTSSTAAARAQASLWPHRAVFTVSPGIDPPMRLSGAARAEQRRSFGISPDAFVIGVAARLQSWKGHHHVIRAVAALRDRGHSVHGLIVGGDAYELEPDYRPTLERLVGQLRLEERITFAGQAAAATEPMQAMDVLVNASDAEPFGIVLLEAMSLGIPVIAVAAGGPAEILEGGAGLLVSSPESRCLVPALVKVIEDRALRTELCERGKARFEARYRAEGMVASLEQALTATIRA